MTTMWGHADPNDIGPAWVAKLAKIQPRFENLYRENCANCASLFPWMCCSMKIISMLSVLFFFVVSVISLILANLPFHEFP